MELRNGALVGGSPGLLPSSARPAFEEGVARVFGRWTALSLAVDNGWGGGDSKAKAEQLMRDVICWFYNGRGPWFVV